MNAKIQMLADKVRWYPPVQTDDPTFPFLRTVYSYLEGDGDPCDILEYLEHAESIQALPYSSVRRLDEEGQG
jgi:hypothetical protein